MEEKRREVNVKEKVEEIKNIISIDADELYDVCLYAINDLKFQKAYASSVDTDHRHHAYPGGLLVHTCEVVDICQSVGLITPSLRDVNLSVLYTAAIWHDYGKIWDYDEDGHKFEFTLQTDHILRSNSKFLDAAAKYNISTDVMIPISACILSYHGRKEYGAIIEPATMEEHILHYADMLSAKFGVGR